MAGRPKGTGYQPTEADRNTVRSMAASGFRHEEIARCLGTKGIDDKTMRRHFRQELDTSSAKANAAIANKLYATALAGNVSCMTFWLKCRARWQEVVRYEHTGLDGDPMQLQITEDGKSEREALMDRIAGLAAKITEPAGDVRALTESGGSPPADVGLAAERPAIPTPAGD